MSYLCCIFLGGMTAVSTFRDTFRATGILWTLKLASLNLSELCDWNPSVTCLRYWSRWNCFKHSSQALYQTHGLAACFALSTLAEWFGYKMATYAFVVELAVCWKKWPFMPIIHLRISTGLVLLLLSLAEEHENWPVSVCSRWSIILQHALRVYISVTTADYLLLVAIFICEPLSLYDVWIIPNRTYSGSGWGPRSTHSSPRGMRGRVTSALFLFFLRVRVCTYNQYNHPDQQPVAHCHSTQYDSRWLLLRTS